MFPIFITALVEVVLLVLMAVPGFIVRKAKMLGDGAVSTLVILLLYVGQPFLTVNSLLKTQFDPSMLLDMLVVFLGAIIFHVIVYFIALPFFRKKNEDERGIFIALSVFCNVGFMGLPVMEALFPGQPEIVVYTAVFSLGSNIMNWTLCAFIVSGDRKAISFKRALLNPAMITMIIALPLFVFNVTFPPEINDFISSFAGIVSPLSMMVLGIRLADMKLKPMFTNLGLYLSSAIKLLVAPLVMFVILYGVNLIVPVPKEIIAVFLVVFAMPTAHKVLSFAELYGKDGLLSAQGTMLSTILSVVTVPLVKLLIELF